MYSKMSPHKRGHAASAWTCDDSTSTALGFKVATATAIHDVKDAELTLQECALHDVKLVRLVGQPHLPPAVVSAPWFTGYAVADVVTLHRVLDSASIGAAVVPGAAASCSPVPLDGQVDDLVHLLPLALAGSSYRADPALTTAAATSVARSQLQCAVKCEETDVVRCRVDGVTVGYFVLRFERGGGGGGTSTPCLSAIIDHFVVSSDGWRRGHGSMMLREAFELARAAGAGRLVTTLAAARTDAVAALLQHGFVQTVQATVYHVWLASSDVVRFNVPHITGRELANLTQAVDRNALDSLGPFTRSCQAWMKDTLGSPMVLLTHSATAALEQAALLCGLGAGDEVVMPSYTFVSTASSVVLRGATPVFVDVDEASLNVSADRIKAALTPRTKAIIVVHYAGIPADMDAIMALANEHGLYVIEDAAQAFLSKHRGRYAGTIGHFGCFSFHYTKNTVCGEGGALCVNDAAFLGAAPIVREKGTNRSDFINKKVAKYEWVGLGSSFEPCELSAAFLQAQLEDAPECARRRRAVCRAYHALLQPVQRSGRLTLMDVDDGDGDAHPALGNGHIFWVLFASADERAAAEQFVCSRGVQCFSHYVPLHLSPAGAQYGRAVGDMQHTLAAGSRLLRLPLWAGMNWTHVHRVVSVVREFFGVAPPTDKETMGLFAPSGTHHGVSARVTVVSTVGALSPKRGVAAETLSPKRGGVVAAEGVGGEAVRGVAGLT